MTLMLTDPLLIAAEKIQPTTDVYFNDPVRWLEDMIDWDRVRVRPGQVKGMASYQKDCIGKLPKKKRVCIRAPHGTGKTTMAAWVILWFACTRDAAGIDWKIPTTASAWRQLELFLWPEVRKWARLLRWDRLKRQPFNPNTELLQLNLKLKFGQAEALASDDPESIEGAHADEILYVFDEAKAIPAKVWEAAEGAFATGEAYALAISTPGLPVGTFADIQMKKPGFEDWWSKHITLQEAIRAGRILKSWAEQRLKQWGAASAVYKNRVLGEFASDDKEGVIPFSWLEYAMMRWQVLSDAKWEKLPSFTRSCTDVATTGEDKTVIALRFSNVIKEFREFEKNDTMETTGYVMSVHQGQGMRGHACIDINGVGAGVVDRAREQGLDVFAFNSSNKPWRETDLSGELKFLNKRAEAWWTLRELLDPNNKYDIALPPDDEMIGDLVAVRYKINSQGKIVIEDKEKIRDRLDRSPDKGDTVAMAFCMRPVEFEDVAVYDERVSISAF